MDNAKNHFLAQLSKRLDFNILRKFFNKIRLTTPFPISANRDIRMYNVV